ncbi:TRAP transporter substrate-binding protein DctP [Marinomonas ostreistagni]|uniref:TRAP transporter substrate-binding protein DctP n=1 Tax=Marinomonas ostreistagni TaxID=359209 RepID=UPI001951F54C|nr:TRAP transporter substrate-binding protein DctP [Marinomonas ostreistagni]MBM6550084.1 TRAP transporter substrate-binding protein DctP [Marinomonas ostreistagni]
MKIKTIGAVALLACSMTTQATNWTGYTYSSVSTTAAVKGMNRISERVDEATNGDFSIRLHLGKTLHIQSADITQAVGDGMIDFAADYFFSGNVPIARVLNLPMLIENDREWQLAYEAIKPMLEAAFANQDVVLLGGYRYPQQVFFTTFEMDELSDVEGHKIRVTSPEQGYFVEQFGGLPITLSGSEVPTALERGVIDGVLTASAGGAKKWHEFLPQNYRFPVNYGNSMIIANIDSFEDLSDTEQTTLANIVREEGDKISDAFIADEQAQMDSQQAKGMVITQPAAGDADTARERLRPYWTQWAKDNGPEYEQALELVLKAIGK